MKPKQKKSKESERSAGPNAQTKGRLSIGENNPPASKWSRLGYPLKSKLALQIFGRLFLLFHVIAITSWSLPKGAPGIENGSQRSNFSEELLAYNDLYVRSSPVQLYILSTGLWQSWDMFAPNPASSDIYADALVYYKNGEVAEFNYPRMYSLPLVAKYEEERYRKFFEHANTDEYLFLPFAQRIAALSDKGPSDPILKIALRRHWYDIPPPENFPDYSQNLWSAILTGNVRTSDIIAPTPPHPTQYNTFVYYTYVPPKEGGH